MSGVSGLRIKPDLGSEGRIWGCCMECLEKRGFMLFPSSWFFLNNFNDGIFLWESSLLQLAVQLARGLDAGGRALARLFLSLDLV